MRYCSYLFTFEPVSEGHPDKVADHLVVVSDQFRARDEAIFRDIEGAPAMRRRS